MLGDYASSVLGWIGYFAVWLCLTVLLYQLVRLSLPAVHRRFRLQALSHESGLEQRMPRWLRPILLPLNPERVALYKELLLVAGAGIDVMLYFVLKRCTWFATLLLVEWMLLDGFADGVIQVWGYTMAAIVVVLTGFDRVWLEQAGRHRRSRITGEIYALCHQLSYYAGARLHLHGKLMRCLPFTTKLRTEWTLLLQEWYEDPEEALYRFRIRVGTDEAYSFAETLSALRQGESDSFYVLLRQRIADYKESLELYKEGRRESYSYVLFVLAGIPIMNTFRVFLHPWVEEGRKLFDTLQ